MTNPTEPVRRRVLIADDEEPILYPMKAYFEAVGWDVDCARAPEEAQALLVNGRYDVAIVDLRFTPIHGSEGLDLLRLIREYSPATRVILLTAYGSCDIEDEARRRGVAAYLQKPTPLHTLSELMNTLVEAHA